MCGIAGIVGKPDGARVGRMLEAQKHRGPDGESMYTDERAAVGHGRLAIIDVAGGAQPIANEDGSLIVTVNGEIYNHKALRRELEGRHQFRTDSDSEVVLHLFEEEGRGCIKRLDGMFAIAIWGKDSGLFLARDPLGIKPLYYGYDGDGNLLWASEIKALIGEMPHVNELPPGSWWSPGEAPMRYYRVPAPTETLSSESEAVTKLEETLVAAVRKRLMADVPLGVFLSGGLDSSLIAAILRREVSGELHSFSVGLEGSADIVNARSVAAYLGTTHHERVLTQNDVISALPKVVRMLESCDPALVRSAIPTHYVSALAAQYVKVVLSGEGADELFAGYEYLGEFDQEALQEELHLITRSLHNSNLQRVDRLTMAHGLEGRVPFLDKTMVALAFSMDPWLKWRVSRGKWVVRRVAERYLPPAIAWRKKEKFAIGTGIGDVLARHALKSVSKVPDRWSAEEWLYWTLFRDAYGRRDVVEAMGRSRSLDSAQRWVSAL